VRIVVPEREQRGKGGAVGGDGGGGGGNGVGDGGRGEGGCERVVPDRGGDPGRPARGGGKVAEGERWGERGWRRRRRRRRGAGRIRKREQRRGVGIALAALVETAAGAGVHWKVALAALVVRWPSVPPPASVGGRWRDGSESGRRGRFGVFWVGPLGQAPGQGWSPVNRSRNHETLLRFPGRLFGLSIVCSTMGLSCPFDPIQYKQLDGCSPVLANELGYWTI
jgi:hypothetical protein